MFRAMTTWTRMTLIAALAVAGGACEHKKPSETKTDTASTEGKPTEGKPTEGKPSATTDGTGSAGALAPPSNPQPDTPSPPPALPSSADTVREPVAADLAEYVKDLPGTGDKLLAEIKTSEGTFHCELYGDKATMTVANFVGLATGKKAWKDPRTGDVMKGKPFYDGLIFHRVIDGFMIQGGDPLGEGTGGPGYDFAEETFPELKHLPGTLSMAKTSQPHSTGSQFFVMEEANPGLDGGYSVFGRCKEVALVKKITALRGPGDVPKKKVVIEKVTISKGG
jgi:peptidyl-prolyl cis-trans isomerase A (cyclophilin A)